MPGGQAQVQRPEGAVPVTTSRRQTSAVLALLAGFWLASACGSSSSGGLFLGNGRACASSADCAGGEPICSAHGVCVACVTTSDCTGGEVCDTVGSQCTRACATTADCDANRVCAARGVCVDCATDADCAMHDGRFCNTTVGQCVACRSDLDCGGVDRFCDTTTAQCIACRVTADCAANQLCQGSECVTHCTSNAQCGGGAPACLIATGSCVECLSDADCSGDKPGCVLSEHRCRDCSATAPCQNGKQCDIAKGQCQ
jgi:hypothetical protein